MTTPFLSVIAAAGLLTSGLSATSETRSAQSMPAHNLAVAQNGAAAGKARTNHLAGGPDDQSPEGTCLRNGGRWDANALRCRKAGGLGSSGTTTAFVIGGAAAAGLIVAVAASGNNSVSK